MGPFYALILPLGGSLLRAHFHEPGNEFTRLKALANLLEIRANIPPASCVYHCVLDDDPGGEDELPTT